jgi:rare lipoprotein A
MHRKRFQENRAVLPDAVARQCRPQPRQIKKARLFAVLVLCLGAAACVSAPPPAPRAAAPVTPPPNQGVYKVGQPYQIDGTWYYPAEQPDYDETGIASWYGPTFYGRRTANGELYDGDALTAAHRTLPMPVNVRVTNLENGRSIVVRVNDRGPYARGRIIDLSRHAAELLGVVQNGTARVRVTYIGRADLNGGPPPSETPPEIANALPPVPVPKVETQALNNVAGAAVAAPTPQKTLPAPIPGEMFAANAPDQAVVTQVPVPSVTHLYVQVGAFSQLQNARTLAQRLGGDLRVSTLQRAGQTLYRVRTGPLNTTEEADAALARITALGSNDAQIIVDQ